MAATVHDTTDDHTVPTDSHPPAPTADALIERLFAAFLGGSELLTVHVGLASGLYAALRDTPSTVGELAARAGVDERYAREWLEQQTAAGLLVTDDVTAAPDRRRYELPSPYATVLLDRDAPEYLGAAPLCMLGLGLATPPVVEAFRTGGGVPYSAYGSEIRHGLEGFNRPGYVNDLAGWLAEMPDVVERLTAGGVIVDLGCGTGSSTVQMALEFPRARVVGIDLDDASVADARRRAASAGVADRVTFTHGDAAEAMTARADLVTIFEALHDMGDPVGGLRAAHGLVASGGAVLVADELVSDTFTDRADEAERFQFAWSVLHCLPATRAESDAVAHGTILRTPTVRRWAAEAGFSDVAVLPIEHDFWRFYRLTP